MKIQFLSITTQLLCFFEPIMIRIFLLFYIENWWKAMQCGTVKILLLFIKNNLKTKKFEVCRATFLFNALSAIPHREWRHFYGDLCYKQLQKVFRWLLIKMWIENKTNFPIIKHKFSLYLLSIILTKLNRNCVGIRSVFSGCFDWTEMKLHGHMSEALAFQQLF